jgi:hypothetical protein
MRLLCAVRHPGLSDIGRGGRGGLGDAVGKDGRQLGRQRGATQPATWSHQRDLRYRSQDGATGDRKRRFGSGPRGRRAASGTVQATRGTAHRLEEGARSRALDRRCSRRRTRRRVPNWIAEGLRDQRIAVDITHDGNEAADRLHLNPYDVVVLDRDLPGIHGDTLCQMITEVRRAGDDPDADRRRCARRAGDGARAGRRRLPAQTVPLP